MSCHEDATTFSLLLIKWIMCSVDSARDTLEVVASCLSTAQMLYFDSYLFESEYHSLSLESLK